MQKLILTSILFFGLLCANAQYTISGKIVSAGTKQPIPSASVFFNNTTKGNATNNDGEFILDNIGAGKFDLVVSCVGYETYILQVQPEKITAPLSIELQIKVKPLEEIVLGNYVKEGWRDWGYFFINNFIGTTPYASNCKIKNPKVIQFRNYKKEGVLKAFADETLEIENKSLGYIIHYKLELFEFNFISKMVVYQGYPLFENMQTKSDELKRRWQANREKVYYGSKMHFMRSLFRNKIVEEGFEIRRLVKIPNLEQQRVITLYSKYFSHPGILNTNDSLQQDIYKDSIPYFISILNQDNLIDFVYPALLTRDSIAYFVDRVTAGMKFSDYLLIIYTKTNEDPAYAKEYNLQRLLPIHPASSVTLINNSSIEIFGNGAIYEGFDLLLSGYWAWSEKIATFLPFDYWPDVK